MSEIFVLRVWITVDSAVKYLPRYFFAHSQFGPAGPAACHSGKRRSRLPGGYPYSGRSLIRAASSSEALMVPRSTACLARRLARGYRRPRPDRRRVALRAAHPRRHEHHRQRPRRSAPRHRGQARCSARHQPRRHQGRGGRPPGHRRARRPRGLRGVAAANLFCTMVSCSDRIIID